MRHVSEDMKRHTMKIQNFEKLTPAGVMKLSYVAQDRVDVAEAVQCVTEAHEENHEAHTWRTSRD